MSNSELIIEGARQNNLKNISLRLPHNKVIAITGVSGSGKSSLAFDTIFAEGQWRFIESLSTYARLFLEKLDRPDVDAIYNIRPAIALEQKNPVKGSRSTVGTLTELYDLFRVLYSRIATPYCPNCGKEIRKWDPSQIVSELLEKYRDEKAVILFETGESVEGLKQRGFYRVWIDGEVRDIDNFKSQISNFKFVEVVLDRLVIRDEPRLSDSIEMAWKEGKERLKIVIFKETSREVLKFSSKNSCDDCNIELPEPTPILFSFNHPVCACPECKGFGNVLIYDEDIIVPDKYVSLSEGAIEMWEKPVARWWKDQMIKGAKKSGIDINKPYNELTKEEKDTIFKGNQHFYGINDFFEELESKRYKLHVRVFLSRYRSPVTCPKCKGRRLCENALAYRIDGIDIAELSNMPVSTILQWFKTLQLSPMQKEISKEAVRQIIIKLQFLKRVGLDYLTLSRQAKTLSGGEYQRVNLSNQLASALTGTLYVLDEPTIGLHPRDTRRIAEIIRELSSLGNTIIVVEHDRDIISFSDWVVEMGPGGGHMGGEVVFSGPMEEFLKTDTLTAKYIKGITNQQAAAMKHKTKDFRARTIDYLTLHGASGNNLKNITLKIPLETLTVVTGVSGSGKSTLIVETLYLAMARHFRIEPEHPLPYKEISGLERIKGVRLINQTPIGKTPRSNPLTYLKIFDPVRKLFAQQMEARAHGYAPGFFSFNVPGGRCETCKGEGYQRMEMYFFEDIFVRCEDCKGRRYKEEALRVTYKGKNISEILEMTVDEAFDFFSGVSEIGSKLALMKDIGLGYLRLGQPATTLSGGEAQRLKICAELDVRGTQSPLRKPTEAKGMLYILDEPTVGLHHNDVLKFMKIIRKLIESGNTAVIIEHNLDVISQADWVIDLGPEGGDKGGNIIFEGTPEELKRAEGSYTGQYLKEYCQP
ncbi:MAG: excinuclease ABC subunit UvrA [Thermodesulfovibrionales bacterium]|jgi:excinuclease ABC subunit A|nr:excinuclease ABC subunit UvrA [Thermodesulfovibrionales bacterium]